MTHTVSDEKYGKLRRRIDEVARRVDQGSIPYDPVMRALTLIIEGEIPQPDFKRDMRKELGWELVEDVREPAEIVIGNLELTTFLDNDEEDVTYEEMSERAKKKDANLGQCHAEYLLDNQEEIPERLKGYVLLFPGTKWRDNLSGFRVPCLFWRDVHWQLDFGWSYSEFHSKYRFLRSGK